MPGNAMLGTDRNGRTPGFAAEYRSPAELTLAAVHPVPTARGTPSGPSCPSCTRPGGPPPAPGGRRCADCGAGG
jgi:hypothetical protein